MLKWWLNDRSIARSLDRSLGRSIAWSCILPVPTAIHSIQACMMPPRRLQDVSTAAQDASRRLQNGVKTLPRRLKTPLDTSKTDSVAVHFWQETFLSWQRTINRSESIKYSSQFTIYSFILTIHNLQFWISSSAFTVHSWRFTCYTALPSTLHQEQDLHA